MARTTDDEAGEVDPELEDIRRRKLQEMMNTMSDDGSDESDWPDKPILVTDDTIDEIAKKYPQMIVDCWAEWCGPCRMIAPTLEEIAKEMQGKVVVGKLNTDENRKTPMKYGIMSIPTILFYKDGEVVGKTVGALPKEHILEAVEQAFGNGVET
jgi:thioredoxin 1